LCKTALAFFANGCYTFGPTSLLEDVIDDTSPTPTDGETAIVLTRGETSPGVQVANLLKETTDAR
jgi:hypothetical protein